MRKEARKRSLSQRLLLPQFVAAFVLFFSEGQLASAQQALDAGVQFGNTDDKAGDVTIYRFTIKVPSQGDLVRTYFPSTVTYEGNLADPVNVCRESLFMQTSEIQNCSFDAALNMFEFPLPANVGPGYFFTYELGYLRNPSYSQYLSGFSLQVLDSADTSSVLFENADTSLRVNEGRLTAQTLTSSSVRVAAATKFTFEFVVTNPVPSGGFIEISFPTSQVEVPESESPARLSVSGADWYTPSQNVWPYGIRFSVPAQGIESGQDVVLELDGMTNPNTMQETDSFQVQTMTASLAKIDTATSGFVLQMQESAQMEVREFAVQSPLVGQITFMTVTLVLPTVYEADGYLTITLPETVTINPSFFSCNYYIGFTSGSDFGQCSMESSSVIRIDKDISQKKITFRVLSIVNPANTKQTGDFIFRIYDPDHNMIASTVGQSEVRYTPTPGFIQEASVTRVDPTVGALVSSSNLVTLTFQSANFLQNGEVVQFKVPQTQFKLTDEAIASNSVSCESTGPMNTQFQVEDCLADVNGQEVVIQYSVSCPTLCQPGSTFVLQVSKGLQNPSWIASDDQIGSVSITTLTSDLLYQVDERLSGLEAQPALVEGSLGQLAFTKTPGPVGEETSFSFSLVTLNQIPSGGRLSISFQDDGLQQPFGSSSMECVANGESFTCDLDTFASGLVSSVTVYEPCGSALSCPFASELSFTVSGLRNPRSTKPIANTFVISTYTQEGFAIDKGSVQAADQSDLEVYPGTFTSVQLVEPSPSQEIVTGKLQTSYTVEATLTNGLLPSLGSLELSFPDQVRLLHEADTATCTAFEQATTDLLSCALREQSVLVWHEYDARDFRSSTIVITLHGAVQNPSSMRPSDTFGLVTRLRDAATGTNYDVDFLSQDVTVTANKASELAEIQIARSDETVSTLTDLSMCLSPSNPWPQGSTLELTFNGDQVEIIGPQRYVYGSIIMQEVANGDSQKAALIVPEDLSPTDGAFCFEVRGNMMNPGTTKPPQASFEISILTADGFLIDQTLTGVFAQPFLSAGPFLSAEIESTGTVVGDETALEIQVQLKSELPMQSKFYIKLPNSVFYITEDGQSVQCSINQSSFTTCRDIQIVSGDKGDYISSFIISTGSKAFEAGNTVSLRAQSLRNKFDTRTLAEAELAALVQSYDNNGYTINTSSVTLKMPTLVPNNGAQILTTVRSNLQVQEPTGVLLEIQTRTRLASASLLRVHLSSTMFELSTQDHLTCLLDSAIKLCSLVETGDYFAIDLALDCGSLCPDDHIVQLEVQGLANRYSTSRGGAPLLSGQGDVFIETYEPTGSYSVDTSMAFFLDDELVPGAVRLDTGSIGLTTSTVGAFTSLAFDLDFEGLKTQSGDHVQINIGSVPGQPLLSCQIFKLASFTSPQVKANGQSFSGVLVLGDSNSFATTIQTQIPATTDSIRLQVANVLNLGRVRPLSATFDVFIIDSYGGQVAHGSSDLVDLEILTPAIFDQVSVERLTLDLAQDTDILVTINLDQVAVMSGSVLSIEVPRDQLDLSTPSGKGTCKHNGLSKTCQAIIDSANKNYVLTTEPFIGGEDSVEVLIKGVFMNPRQVTFSNASIRITLTNEAYLVGLTPPESSIFVEPPLSKEELRELQLSQEGLIAGQQTVMTLSFKLKNQVPEESLVILSLPDEVLIASENDSYSCEIQAGAQALTAPCDLTVYSSPKTRKGKSQEPSYAAELRVYPGQAGSSAGFMQQGSLNLIRLKGLKNVEYAKDRGLSSEKFTVSIVTPNSFVVAQDTVPESTLPSLTQGSINEASVTRLSNKIGELGVPYTLTFTTPNAIQSNSYALISVPKDEIELREADLEAQEVLTRQQLDLSLDQGKTSREQQAEAYYTFKLEGLCLKEYCKAGTTVVWELELANSNRIVLEEDAKTVFFTVYTNDGHPIQHLETGSVKVEPRLEGTQLPEFEMQRVHNLIGAIDTLKFYVPPLPVSIFTDTNLVVELPSGMAYSPDATSSELVCFRELTSGEQVSFDCEGVSFTESRSGNEGAVLRNVRIRGICDQFYVCFKDEPLAFSVQVKNPSTNQKGEQLGLVKIFMRQADGVDIGSGSHVIELPAMQPNTAGVSMQTLPSDPEVDCKSTGEQCFLMVNVTTTNPMRGQSTGSYLSVTVSDDFQVLGTTCWALIEPSSQVNCFMVSPGTLEVRLNDNQVTQMIKAGNKITFIVQNVRMPLTLEPALNAQVKSFELLSTGRYSLVDTNEGREGTSAVLTGVSQFRTFEVLREKDEIGARSALRVTLQVQHLETLTYGVNEVFLEIKFPRSAGSLNQPEKCMSGMNELVQDACKALPALNSHEVLQIGKLTDFCSPDTLLCRVYLSEYINSWYATDLEDPLRDTFAASLYFESDDGRKVLLYDSSQGGVYARPTLLALSVSIDQATLVPENGLKTSQEVGLDLSLSTESTHVFDSPFLMVKFDTQGYAPLLSFEQAASVKVNDRETTFRKIETKPDGETITTFYIDMPPVSQEVATLSVKVRGLVNPGYVHLANSEGSLHVKILGGSLDRWEIRAEGEPLTFEADLKPFKFQTLVLHSTSPWPGAQTDLEIDMSMTNRISQDQVYQLEFEMPSGFALSREDLTCSNIVTNETLACEVRSDDKIVVQQLSTRRTESLLSFMAMSLSIGPVFNPYSPITDAQVTVRVYQDSSSRLFVEDTTPIFVKEKADPSDCPPGCAECSVDGTCYACIQPSVTPLLYPADGLCHATCPDGAFAQGDKCLACNQECSSCHSLDQCTSCYKDEDKVFVDGRCLSQCPQGTSLNNTVEAVCVRDLEPVGDESDSTDGLPIFAIEESTPMEPCAVSDCAACGLSSDFCSVCAQGFSRSEGQCVDSCDQGYFSAQSACFRCSSQCETCSRTANQCDSCPSNDQVFTNTKLLLDYRICTQSCPPGTFDNDGECQPCSDACNTCSRSADRCTSCFMDKTSLVDVYLTGEGKCVEKCPRSAQTNYLMHTCEPLPATKVFSITNSWPTQMTAVAIGAPLLLLGISKAVSMGNDRSRNLAVGLYSVSEGAARAASWVAAWQAQNLICFCLFGVSMLCSTILAVVFYETVFAPVQRAIYARREVKGIATGQSTRQRVLQLLARLLAYTSSLNAFKLLASGFCGFQSLRQDLADESPCFYLKKRVEAAKVQLILTVLTLGAGVYSLITDEQTADLKGCGVASLTVSAVSLGLQFKLIIADKSQSGGYRTLQSVS